MSRATVNALRTPEPNGALHQLTIDRPGRRFDTDSGSFYQILKRNTIKFPCTHPISGTSRPVLPHPGRTPPPHPAIFLSDLPHETLHPFAPRKAAAFRVQALFDAASPPSP